MNTPNPDLTLSIQIDIHNVGQSITKILTIETTRRSPTTSWVLSPQRDLSPSSNMEPYDGSFDHQEHKDAFKSRMALAGVSDLVKCRAFPITLKKAALKWFNSLPQVNQPILRPFFAIFWLTSP